MSEVEFSVYWWDCNDNQHEELRFTNAEKAISAAKRLCTGPAAEIGIVRRVIVTDGGDYTNFEWIFEKGMTFPPPPKRST